MRTYSGNHSFLKELNIISALRLIQEKNLISRAALAETLGLNRSTITAIINELINQRLVKEVGIGASQGGRPPTLLQFNSDAAYTVSIDWSPKSVKVFITNLSGDIFFSREMETEPNQLPHNQILQVVQVISSALQQLPDKHLGLLGIGIIVPGIVEKGVVNSYSLDWESVPVSSFFAEKFACPIVINNDATAGLIAESYFGCAKGEQHACYIRVGKSLSVALILDGQIYRGSEGFTGRIGHNTLVLNGRKCVCGNKGCWEAYTSERALIQRYNELSGRKGDLGKTTPELIIEAAKNSDPHAISAIHELSEYLGIGIANIVNLLNPKLIVIGNTLGMIESLISPPLNSALMQKALPFLRRNLKVSFSNLNERSITLGATALVLDAIFSTPNIKLRE